MITHKIATPMRVRTSRAIPPRTVAGIPFLAEEHADKAGNPSDAASRVIRFVRNPNQDR
jgi:hypothetical protein